jgi:phosphatidylserine/phosphatidylglycerophosphate/cardiolipin synthase-like enzyme
VGSQEVVDASDYLRKRGYALDFDNMLEHCKALAEVTLPDAWSGSQAPLYTLLRTIGLAKHFVHFVSFGISEFFIGALKLAAQRVSVRGVVANVDERQLDELTTFAESDTPYDRFEIKHFLRQGEWWRESPHQKLIVIDGLVAFKGSANLTLTGWRKAMKGLDHVEVVTNVTEVIDLHNKLFSPVWAQFSKIGDAVKI